MLHIYINKYTTCILSITLDMHFYSTFLRSCANTELFPWAKSWSILSETVYGSEASRPECYWTALSLMDIRYDRTCNYLTYAQQLTSSQLGLPCEVKLKNIRK